MATGKRAFERGTTAETLTAIIREEPEPVSQLNARVPAPVRWIVERCLAKEPEDRYGTTKDLARELAQIRDHLSEAPVSDVSQAHRVAAPAAKRPAWIGTVAAILLAGAVGVAAYGAGKKAGVPALPSFRELTFHRGEIHSARFAPDGQTVIYAAAWEDRPVEIFVSRLESPESRPFGLKGAALLSVSSTGELAVSLNRRIAGGFSRTGTLARIGMTGGGTPREIQEDVQAADWAPDGKDLAIVRMVDGHNRLEFPIGKVLYDAGASGWISYPRISHDGTMVAFMDHPTFPDDGGYVSVVDREGHKKSLTPLYAAEAGVAWSPRGDEIWFAAAEVGNNTLHAATLSGKVRPLASVTGNLTLHDVTPDGRVLLSHDTLRSGIFGLAPGESRERDLSWLDWSNVADLSPDGKTMVFLESGEGGGPGYSVYTRATDGSPPVRLGEGSAQSLSPDGKWVFSIVHLTTDRTGVLLPTGAGDPKPVPTQGLLLTNATWLPDGKRILLTANEPSRGSRLYILELDGGKTRAVSPVGYTAYPRTVSPDGRRVAARGPDNRVYIYPLDGGEPTSLAGLGVDDIPCGWTPEGRDLYVFRRGEFPGRVFRLDFATGEKSLWKNFAPGDPAGILTIGAPRMTPDGKAYVYAYNRILSDLFLATGIK
jgi:Tol biopolymer transport system component